MTKYKKKIEKWIDQCIEEGAWKTFHDLHITALDKSLQVETQKNKWIPFGVELLMFVEKAIKDTEFLVILSFDLDMPLKRYAIIGMPQSVDEIFADDLSYTPPSTYIFHRGCKTNCVKVHKLVEL